jgi:hypothetical protein
MKNTTKNSNINKWQLNAERLPAAVDRVHPFISGGGVGFSGGGSN